MQSFVVTTSKTKFFIISLLGLGLYVVVVLISGQTTTVLVEAELSIFDISIINHHQPTSCEPPPINNYFIPNKTLALL